MTTGSATDGLATDAALLERLSALADGELDDAAAALTCAAWRREAAACTSWHAYHLIGDVLRSHDLAAHPARDAAFLCALRDRLAKEPVVIAPRQRSSLRRIAGIDEASAVHATRRARRHWQVPAAVAAGFAAVAVATVFVVTRPVEPGAAVSATFARADASAAAQGGNLPRAEVIAARDPAALTPASITSGRLIRSAQLDAYLAAHKQFAGSSALAVPSAYQRTVMTEGTGR